MTDTRADLSRLGKAHRRMWAAREAYSDAVKACLPVGAVIEYKHGEHWREVTVTGHSMLGERVVVRGRGGLYWVHAARFLP